MNDELFDVVAWVNSKNQNRRMIAQAGMYDERFYIPEKYVRTARTLVHIIGNGRYFSMEDADDEVKARFQCTNKPDLEMLLCKCERVGLLTSFTHDNVKSKRGTHSAFSLSTCSSNQFVNLLLLFGDCLVKEHFHNLHDPISPIEDLLACVLTESYANYSFYNLMELHTKGKPVFVDKHSLYYDELAIYSVKRKIISDIVVKSTAFKDSYIKDLPALFDTSVVMHADVVALIAHDKNLNHLDDKMVRKGNTYVLGDVVTIDLEENKNNLLLQ